jgi:putative sterol carrier protein
MAYTTTAKQWFDDVATSLVAQAPAALGADLAGPVLFDIGGDDGGAWLVDFAARTVTATDADAAKSSAQPRVIVRAFDRDFMALVEGRMSADDGIVTKRLHVAGDLAAIAHLMDAVAPARR